MVGQQVMKDIPDGVLLRRVVRGVPRVILFAAIAGGLMACSPLALLDVVKGLVERDTLGPIEEVSIAAAGDSVTFGDTMVPPYTVTQEHLSASYYMSKYEITNAQFKQFVDDAGYTTQSYWTTNGWAWRTNPMYAPVTQPGSWLDSNFSAANKPVSGVSWYEAVAFCNWRSVKEHLTPAYDLSGRANLAASGYRLPTEVEWQYAAAKGAPGQAERAYAYGNTADPSKEVAGGIPNYYPAAVGSKSTAGDTPQGLADMSGNVNEWCSDNLNGVFTGSTDQYNFTTDAPGTYMIARGGSYNDMVDPYSRSSSRYNYTFVDSRFTMAPFTFGFRTVRR